MAGPNSSITRHAPMNAGFALFFRRAGAWLALLHVFAATDMHQENMIACGDHPVPIDLETILQPSADEHKMPTPKARLSTPPWTSSPIR